MNYSSHLLEHVFRYCGSNSPGLVSFLGNAVTVYFHTDINVEFRGFQASYEVLFEGLQKFISLLTTRGGG